MKKIVPLLLFTVLFLTMQQKSVAQLTTNDTSYHLFFYKGKKVKENMLLTPAGDTVSYNPVKKTLKKVSKGGSGKRLDNMLAEVKKTDRRMKETLQKLAAGLPPSVAPYFARPLKESFEETRDRYGAALSNTLVIAEMPGPATQATPMNAGGKAAENTYADNLQESREALYRECREYIRTHRDEDIEVPDPPAKDYRYCAQCEAGIKERYKQAYAVFHEKLQGEETRLLGKLLALERARQLAGLPAEENTVADSTIQFIMKRLGKKANRLLETYGNDPLRIESAIPAALSIERMRQLFGIPETDPEALKMEAVTSALKNLLGYLETAVDEYDYAIALNPTLLLSVYRQYLLLGGDGSQLKDPWAVFNKALRLNAFKLSIKVSGKLSGKDVMQLAELKGDNYFAAVIDSASATTCRLKWVLLGPDPAKRYMKFDLVDAQLKGNGAVAVYAGTRKWESMPPKLRVDFCGNGNDTAFISSFRPDGKELWSVPEMGVRELPFMNNILLACFVDAERIKREADKTKMAKKMEEMKRQAEEFKKNYAAGQAPSPSQMQNMMSQAKALSAGSMVSDMMQEFAVESYLVLPSPQNKNMRIFKERLDGRQLFPQNTTIEYAWFDIILEQDPDCPFKMKFQ